MSLRWLTLLEVGMVLMIIPSVLATSSELSLWVGSGSSVSVGGYVVTLYTVGPNGYATIGLTENGTNGEAIIVGPGDRFEFGPYSMTLNGWLVTNSTSYARLNVSFPYLPVGDSFEIGNTTVKLLSVTENNATLQVNGRTVTTEGVLRVDGFVMNVVPMPEIFTGYLRINRTQEIDGMQLRILGRTSVRIGPATVDGVRISINGKVYRVAVGLDFRFGSYMLKVTGIADSYVGLRVRAYGAIVRYTEPETTVKVPVGGTILLHGHMISVNGVVDVNGTMVNLTIAGRTVLLPLGHGVRCANMTVGPVGVFKEPGTGEEIVKLVIFGSSITGSEMGILRRWLSVSIEAPRNVTMGERFNVTIEVKNSGNLPISSLTLSLKHCAGLTIGQAKGTEFKARVENLKPGGTEAIRVSALPLHPGDLTLGPVEVKAVYPDGSVMRFSSGVKIVHVLRPKPKLRLSLISHEASVGEPTPLVISIRNMGNASVPFNLTVSVPEVTGVTANGFSIYGRWLWKSGVVGPGNTVRYTVYMVPTRAGRYDLVAIAKSYGVTFRNSTVLRVKRPSPKVETLRETCRPKVVTRIVRYNSSTEGNAHSWNLIMAVALAFAAGAGFILLLAWIAARLEE